MLARTLIQVALLVTSAPAWAGDSGLDDSGPSLSDSGLDDTGGPVDSGDTGDTADTADTADTVDTDDTGSSSGDGVGAAELADETGGFGCNTSAAYGVAGTALGALAVIWLLPGRRRERPRPVPVKRRRP